MTSIGTLASARVYLPKPYTHHIRSHPISISIPKPLKTPNFTRKFRVQTPLVHQSLTILCKSRSGSASQPGEISNPARDDFVTRVLKENPSQVEPKFLIGDKLFTLKEKEDLSKGLDANVIETLAKKLNLKVKSKKESEEGRNESGEGNNTVYLKDILREYKGKLYVPEQIFGAELSEEEEFNRNLEALPKMCFEDFRRAMECDKIKSLTSKEGSGVSGYGYRDFIVDLKEIPGDKSLQRTKWAMRLDENQALAVLEEYKGPQYEIEGHMTVINLYLHWIGLINYYFMIVNMRIMGVLLA